MRQSSADGRGSEAVSNARRRIVLLAGSIGTRHPDYATALNQLALALIMEGDQDAAEPFLREALSVRLEALGDRHPDYATNLSSLGGLLWARGDLDGAEPLLRQAVEVRQAILGPGHPKSVVSRKSLEQLLDAKRDLAVEDVPADASEILAEFDSIRVAFASLGDLTEQAAHGLLTGGLPPSEAMLSAWSEAGDRFERLRREAEEVIHSLGLPMPVDGSADLDGVAALVNSIREAEVARGAAEGRREEAVAVLDRVSRLRCPKDPDLVALVSCLEKAKELRRAIEAANLDDLPAEVRTLTDGSHPLVTLLNLVSADEAASDTQWADWHDAVEAGLGNGLAVAAARGRIVA